MSMNLVTLLYLIASVCFIQALKGLSPQQNRIALQTPNSPFPGWCARFIWCFWQPWSSLRIIL